MGSCSARRSRGVRPRPLPDFSRKGAWTACSIASSTLNDDFIRAIVEHGPGPVVPVNRRVEGVASSVVVDDEAASSTAVEYLRSLGHLAIGGIFGPPQIDTSVRRKSGFSAAVARYGLAGAVVERPGWSAEDGYEGTLRLLADHPRTTAVYASTFLMGIGALRAAAESGRPVPQSLSVICLHDSPLAGFLVPPLTAVRLPTQELGAAAVELFVELAAGGPERAVMIEGEGEIVERAVHRPGPAGLLRCPRPNGLSSCPLSWPRHWPG